MSSKHLTVPEVSDGVRLDRFLAESLPLYSRSQLQEMIVSGKVTGIRALEKSRLLMRAGETLSIELPDPDQILTAVEGQLPILFENEQIIVIDKPAGLPVHPIALGSGTSVVQILLSMRPELIVAVYDPDSKISRLRPGIVHRLDKDTTGVLAVAKTSSVLLELAEQFRTHQVHKIYLALLSGDLPHAKTVDAPLQRKPGRENMMGIAKDPEQGREAISHFLPLEHFHMADGLPACYVNCQIETGRTHQIRAHAKSIGLPVIGDQRYGNRPSEAIAKKLDITRQMLHTHQLSLNINGQLMTFTSPLPTDFSAPLDRLRHMAFDNASMGMVI